ncbi:MAG: 50S ribosomal protein L6 [Synechococcales cyanobacterium RM1_1_8]|nr:50S ribosomal protein L6 [Synechococcales cyanobacterium RM1_1_8]
MSRIGKRPIPIPDKVQVTLAGNQVSVKGPKGELSRELPVGVSVEQVDNMVVVNRDNDSRTSRERHGLCRTLVANMVDGVSSGFSKKLEIIGVGYRAQLKGKTLVMNLGYSNPVEMEPPEGITFEMEGKSNTTVIVSGISKELVGNTAARVRAARPPEPYKGKGVRYDGEQVRRKAGKSGKK